MPLVMTMTMAVSMTVAMDVAGHRVLRVGVHVLILRGLLYEFAAGLTASGQLAQTACYWKV